MTLGAIYSGLLFLEEIFMLETGPPSFAAGAFLEKMLNNE